MTAPGTVITLSVAVESNGGKATSSTVIVVRSPLDREPVYCQNFGVRTYRTRDGETFTWRDPNLAGRTIRWEQRVGSGYVSVEGVMTNDNRILVNGQLIKVSELQGAL